MPPRRPLIPSGCHGKHSAISRVGVHTHLLCRFPILCRRAHRKAQFRESEEGKQQPRADDPDGGDQQVERADRPAPIV
jgi:hypothetical protein